MDNSYKNILNEANKNNIKDNLEKIILKKSRMNEFLKDFQKYKNQSNNTSLNKENKIFISQNNALEISKEYKVNNESNKISYILSSDILSSDKKEPNIINKNKLFKKEKIKILNKDRKSVLTNNDLVSPRYSFNNKNIRTPKPEIKNKIKYKYINKKKIEPINIASFSNANKKGDTNLKQKKTCRTFRIITENNYDHDNESLNNRKVQENTLNYDNIRLVKMPEANDLNVFFYNNNLSNRNKSINHDIFIKAKKNRNLSLALNQRNSNIHKYKRIYSLNEESNRKNTTNTNIYQSEKKKLYNRYNDLYINTDENINHENNGLEKDINYSVNNDVNNLTKSLSTNNNNKKKKMRCFSEDKAKTKKIKYNNVLKKFANNINFNDIEKIFYLDNNKFNDDEIISEIEMNKNDNSNNIPDSLLMEIPEEDIQENENNNIIKKINHNNIKLNGENNRKNIKTKKRKIELFLNDNAINFTTNNGQNGHKGAIEKIKNKTGTWTTKNKIKKISEYFHNNKRNNNNKNFNYICHTVRNNISKNKILFTDTKDKNENSNNNVLNILNKNKSKEQRYIKLTKQIEELKKEEEKVLILKEKYNNLINKLKSDINIFNNKNLNEIILFEKNKKEEIELTKNEKNKIFIDEESNSNNNNEINNLKEQINKLKEEIKLKDDIHSIFTTSFNKKLDMQNKINNDLELKIKIYKAIIENNENEYLNTNDINNLIINNNNNKYQKTDRNLKQKAKNQKNNKNIENELCVQTIKNHIYNRTLYNFNSKYKNITNDIIKNGITKSYKKNKNFKSQFYKNKNSELNIKINNNYNYNFTSNSNNNTKLNILHKKINKSGKNVLLTSNFMMKSKNLNENNKTKKVIKYSYNTNSKKSNRTEQRFNKNKNYLEDIKNNTTNNFKILLNTEKKKMNGFETRIIKKNNNLSKPKGKHRSSCNLNFIDNKKDNIINNLIKKKDVNLKKNKKDLKKEKREIYLLTQRDKEKENNNNYKDNKEKIEDDCFNNYDMVFLEKYHPKDLKLKIINQEETLDGKIIIEYSNQKKEIIFNNKDNLVCIKKEIFDDGYQIIYFKNKDIKQIYPDGKEVYFFSENRTVATTLKNGDKIYKFANGQIEKIFKNGEKTIKYPDGTIKNIYLNGEEEILYNDGSKQKKNKDGSIFIKYKEGEDDVILLNESKERKFSNEKNNKK